MREILFRGKRLYCGYWVYGAYIKYHDGKNYIRPVECEMVRVCGYEVDPATVGQYTGLDDKDGVQIFEGDIIDCNNHGYEGVAMCVIFYKGSFLVHNDKTECSEEYAMALRYGFDVRVIGNVHDNPELLKEEAK